MCMQKNELFKAVKELCWPGDARLLWKGLDKEPLNQCSYAWVLDVPYRSWHDILL